MLEIPITLNLSVLSVKKANITRTKGWEPSHDLFFQHTFKKPSNQRNFLENVEDRNIPMHLSVFVIYSWVRDDVTQTFKSTVPHIVSGHLIPPEDLELCS